jgi:1-deoxy-D-xylulose-5-phosphate reductoisomerase
VVAKSEIITQVKKFKPRTGAGKHVVILGSTGSIGRSAIDVIRRLPGFKIVGLTARSDVIEMERQARALAPKFVAMRDESAARELRSRLSRRTEVLAGSSGVAEAAAREEGDIVLSAIVGSAGLVPTFEAVRLGKRIALANKETLVAGGALIVREMKKSGAVILPVDSEHSAIFQCLEGQDRAGIRRLIITGSGGPFRTLRSLKKVTVRQALRHPTWRMGRKITIDSATLMNKGLEIIEAHWLFGLPVSAIDVLIHPQSIVHSMVEFVDGAVLAQMGLPDMKLPIQYALTWPKRAPAGRPRLDLAERSVLTFEPPDPVRFPCLSHARAAAEAGGSAPAVLSAANEVAVQGFLDGLIGFDGISRIIGETLETVKHGRPDSVEEVLEIDRAARAAACGIMSLQR